MAFTAPVAAQTVIGNTLPAPQPPAEAQDQAQESLNRFARARDNLAALRDGRRSVGELTLQELQDVIDFDARVRGNYPDNRTPRQQCVEAELQRLRGQPSRLDWQVIRLKCRD